MTAQSTRRRKARMARRAVRVMTEHQQETCDHDYCGGCGPWCSSDSHPFPLPDWPCSKVLRVTGDKTAEAYWEREGAAWEAWARSEGMLG